MRIFLLVFILALTVAAPAWATTYYVDKLLPGSNSNNGTSEATPFLTIQKCLDTLKPRNTPPTSNDDTCLVKNGTYTEALVLQPSGFFGGTIGHSVSLKNFPGHAPKIDATGVGNHGFALDDTPTSTNGITYFTIEGLEITGALYSAIKCLNCSHVTFRLNYFHDNGTVTIAEPGNGIRAVGPNNLIEKNRIVRQGNEVVAAYGHGLYLTGENWTVINNIIEQSAGYNIQVAAYLPGANSPDATYGNFSGLIANNTLAYSRKKGGITLWTGTPAGVVHDTTIENNLFYENGQLLSGGGQAIGIYAGATRITIKNNYSWATTPGATGFIGSSDLANCSSCTITANTWDTFNPNMVNAPASAPASPDFRLTASSGAAPNGPVNFGIAIAGYAYNESAPEAGAFETWTHAVCSVADATPTVINITYNNNRFPPLLPSSGLTGFSARENAGAKTVTGATRIGTNQVNVTVSSAFSAGTSIDYSWSGGNLTDSALIANSLNQSLLPIVNQTCTNNVSGSPSFVFTQTRFRWHGLRGTESSPEVKPYQSSPDSTHTPVVVGGKARLRIKISCTVADCPQTGFTLRYAKNGGSYTLVPDQFDTDNIRFFGNSSEPDVPTDGTSTTELLTSDYATNFTGLLVRSANAIPTVNLGTNSETELEYVIEWATAAVPGTTYDFRLYKQDGTVLNTYTVTPRATIMSQQMGMGF